MTGQALHELQTTCISVGIMYSFVPELYIMPTDELRFHYYVISLFPFFFLSFFLSFILFFLLIQQYH